MNTKRNYLLLTPGPLSTSETVREAMLQDWCTWDKDYNEGIVTPIRKGLLAIAGLDEDEYTDVLLQGSGTYCVEATIGAAVKPTDKLLILANGAYGKRMAQIAKYYHIDHVLVSLHETELITGEVARRALEENPGITIRKTGDFITLYISRENHLADDGSTKPKEYSLDRNGQIKHKEKMEADDYEVYAKLKEEIENGVKKLNEMYSNIYE